MGWAAANEQAASGSAKVTIATISQEIAVREIGIRVHDQSVAEATGQLEDENAEFKALVASDIAAQEVLEFADKFSNLTLYTASPPAELPSEDRNYGNLAAS